MGGWLARRRRGVGSRNAVVESWDKPLRGRLEAADVVSTACSISPQLLVGPQRASVLTTGINLRCARHLPSLRLELMHLVIKKAIADTRREDFRIVEYSVQDDPLHMIVDLEAIERDFAAFVAGKLPVLKADEHVSPITA